MDDAAASASLEKFRVNEKFLGYGYLEKPEDTVPPVGLTFYAFHVMVLLGTLFGLIFILNLFYSLKGTLAEKTWLQVIGVPMFFLSLIASQAGWVVAEVGRQPWAIQDLLPLHVATTNIAKGNVQATFFMFLVIFTLLLFAEIRIMLKQIKIGPEEV
jgi:cytochrome d ubiquinol oxidase subunit I